MEAERIVPPESNAKDKGLQQSEVFEARRVMNGAKPIPSVVKKSHRWVCFFTTEGIGFACPLISRCVSNASDC